MTENTRSQSIVNSGGGGEGERKLLSDAKKNSINIPNLVKTAETPKVSSRKRRKDLGKKKKKRKTD